MNARNKDESTAKLTALQRELDATRAALRDASESRRGDRRRPEHGAARRVRGVDRPLSRRLARGAGVTPARG